MKLSGLNTLDNSLYFLTHFALGFIGSLVIFPDSPIESFAVNNLLHALLEFVEHNKSPDGKILETCKDHILDHLFFTMGSMLGIFIDVRITGVLYYTLLLLWILSFIQEFGREFFPYSWIHDPAFTRT